MNDILFNHYFFPKLYLLKILVSPSMYTHNPYLNHLHKTLTLHYNSFRFSSTDWELLLGNNSILGPS